MFRYIKQWMAAIVTFCILLCLSSAAFAKDSAYYDEESQRFFALSCLTEVYGYTAEEAERFVFEVTQEDGNAIVSYWHPDFPDWIYKSFFSLEDGFNFDNTTPFYCGYYTYPGESSVRCAINAILEGKLLENWNKASRDAFAEIITKEEISVGLSLEKGLADAGYPPQQAIKDLFLCCYGEEYNWTVATKEWYLWVLESCSLPEPVAANRQEGVYRYRHEGEQPFILTEFVDTIPPELVEVLKHPKLEGWKLHSGVTFVRDEKDEERNQFNHGLIAFENGSKRMLCLLYDLEADRGMRLYPLGETVLPEGCKPQINVRNAKNFGHSVYQIAFQSGKDDVLMIFSIISTHNGDVTCQLDSCTLTEPDGTIHRMVKQYGNHQYSLSHNYSDMAKRIDVDMLLPIDVVYLDIAKLLDQMKNPDTVENFALPESTVLLSGVHLRQEKSSHSKDLGMFIPGAIVQKLSIESGNPDPWYHVRVGTLEGYVSGAYVHKSIGEAHRADLPVAVTTEALSLKEHTGLFAADAAQVEAGTTMHVLIDDGTWSYVCIPKQQPAGMWMDPEGTFGYVKNSLLRTGSSALMLEWFAE